jgi:hypothetical protein
MAGEYVVLKRLRGNRGFADVTDSHPNVGSKKGDSMESYNDTWRPWVNWTNGRYTHEMNVAPKVIFGDSWGPEYDYSGGPTVYIVTSTSAKRRVFRKIKGTGSHTP